LNGASLDTIRDHSPLEKSLCDPSDVKKAGEKTVSHPLCKKGKEGQDHCALFLHPILTFLS